MDDPEASSSKLESTEEDHSELHPHDDEFPKLFFINDINSIDAVIRSFEYKTNTKFTTKNIAGYFGCNKSIYSGDVNPSILFEDKCGNSEGIPFDGVPFFAMGHRTMICRFGLAYMAKHLEKRREERRRRGAKPSKMVKIKKTDCRARIVIREVHKFPEFQIDSDTKELRDQSSHSLNEAFKKKEVVGERRFYICLPRRADHSGHALTQEEVGITDRIVLNKIRELLKEGIMDSRQLQKATYDYVRNELFKGTEAPPETDSRFFPSRKRIHSMCTRWRKRMREKENKGPMSVNGTDTLPLTDDSADKEKHGGKEQAEAVSGDEEVMDDEDWTPTSHENKSIGSASAMTEFNSHLKGCNDLMDHIKNLLILSGDRRVASYVKKRLGKIVKDLENSANMEKKT